MRVLRKIDHPPISDLCIFTVCFRTLQVDIKPPREMRDTSQRPSAAGARRVLPRAAGPRELGCRHQVTRQRGHSRLREFRRRGLRENHHTAKYEAIG